MTTTQTDWREGDEALRTLYVPVALRRVEPGALALAGAMFTAGVITGRQLDDIRDALALPLARRLQAADLASTAKRDGRRGLARLLNIGQ
jgi:hypothetical protein